MMFPLLFTALLLIAAGLDLKTRTIHPVISIAVLMIAPLYAQWSYADGLCGFVMAGGILLLPCLFVPDAFGGGDIKLAAACGYALGFSHSIAALFIAVTLSLIPCVYHHLKKSQTHVAFAPYLAAGFLAALFLL